MNIILLSGGSGIRLWPLSNEARSKQFLKLLPDGEGGLQSMTQRVHTQIRRTFGSDAHITIATSETQIDSITTQIGAAVDIVTEPERRDTYPAILLACAYLYYEKGVSEDEPILVAPVDPYTEDSFYSSFRTLAEAVASDVCNIALLGIKPTIPTSKYGYIVPASSGDGVVPVSGFVEKPDTEKAMKLIEEGALWNGGVFAFKLGYLIKKLEAITDERSFDGVRAHYSDLTKISFDYAVVEKEQSIGVLSYDGEWKDLGTWNTFSEQMGEYCIGNVTADDNCENTHVVNELDIPIVALGTKNLVISASYDGILVTDKERSGYMKDYVEQVRVRPMYKEKRWGESRIVDYLNAGDGAKALTRRLTLHADKSISYHIHNNREEIWTIVSGEGEFVLDDKRSKVKGGDVLRIPPGAKHSIRAGTDLYIIEVQLGTALDDSDIVRLSMEW